MGDNITDNFLGHGLVEIAVILAQYPAMIESITLQEDERLIPWIFPIERSPQGS
jgi:hypothetical protein